MDEAVIDDAAGGILILKYQLDLFDDPYKYCDEEREQKIIGSKENREAVLDMAKKSIVLLKNENNLLPLKKQGQKTALIGALAADDNSPLGSWRIASDDHSAVSVLKGMQAYKGNTLNYAKGADVIVGDALFIKELTINTTDTTGFAEATAAAKTADVVVMVLGEHGFQSGEGRSRSEIALPGVQQQLLETVYRANPNIVLVLNNGRPLTIPWADENIPAIVEAWHLGTESGNAIAQVLYGDYNPSGKLPMTFPRNVGQIPIYYNHLTTGRPDKAPDDMVFWSHYMDVPNTPLYPFGFGLSYTTFDYLNLKLSAKEIGVDDQVKVSVTVKNTGDYDGKEVVQLYIHDLYASLARPVRELKAFELVDLKKGESKTITFSLDKNSLGFYDQNGEYIIEPGAFEIFVGGDSNAELKTGFEVK